MFRQDFYEIPSTVRLSKITQSEYDANLEALLEACQEETTEETTEETEEEASCICSSSCRCLLSASSCSCSTMQHSIDGKDGAKYMRHGGFCFCPHQYPDAVNHVNTRRCDYDSYLPQILFYNLL